MSDQDVLRLVTNKINANQPSKFRLTVFQGGIKHEGDWFYVAVSPDGSDIRVSDYNAVLVGVEDSIKNESQINVLLVPTLPD